MRLPRSGVKALSGMGRGCQFVALPVNNVQISWCIGAPG